MPSIARHHAEWLSLLEISGPFLSMPVLLRAFPQGLDALDPDVTRQLRLAYDEWQTDASPAIHSAWVRFVLDQLLELPAEFIAQGQAIPAGIKAVILEHAEVLRPDLAVIDSAAPTQPRLLIQVLPPEQDPNKVLPDKRWKASPASRMAELLRATGVRVGLVTNGEQWMLVDAPPKDTAGFSSWYASLWLDEPLTLRAFRSLLGARRFFGVPENEVLEALLADSANDQQEVTDQLGYQVRRAIEVLVESIDHANQDRNGSLLADISPAQLYEAALTVMMRLVFLLCAEERGLLLLGDPLYDQHYAVSTLRAQLREMADQNGEEGLERRFDAWYRLLATFRAVYSGVQHDLFNLPAYGGGLFDPDQYPFLQLPINNRTVLHLLEALQVLQVKVPGGGPAEARRLSFRALDVEQIGHVYEGLLDHTAVRASEPVLGLTGTKDKEPELALVELERQVARGNAALIDFLREQTGRSETALRKALDTPNVSLDMARLHAACGNDDALYKRVVPFAEIIRADDFGFPVVVRAGSVYVTAGTDRRSSGTHYTPRSLTEPIVQHTLEPLVYVGPAEGKPKDAWALRSPRELLSLKVCDMAMGSGAFLVQACRYLAERLVEAWEALEQRSGSEYRASGDKERGSRGAARSTEFREKGSQGEGEQRQSKIGNPKSKIRITPEGELSQGKPGEVLIPQEDEERLTFARRLVAERCIYGVDKNPLAVEIAKLSMWLTTLDKGKPFTFLNHALKCGDSLVGVNLDQLCYWTLTPPADANTPELFGTTLREDIDKMVALRVEIERTPDLSPEDLALKQAKLMQAEAIAHDLKQAATLLVGSYFNDLPTRAQITLRHALLTVARDMQDVDDVLSQTLDDEAQRAEAGLQEMEKVRPFHWPLEFPEVFAGERNGFDAFVGNPPFIGGRRIREALGEAYRLVLYDAYPDAAGNADLCAFFFLHAYNSLQHGGALGLLATNTIAQGDTRETGLDRILNLGGTIYRASNDTPWPGDAAVAVDIIHIFKGAYQPPYYLDNRPTVFISSLLDSRQVYGRPNSLKRNEKQCYQGSLVRSMGFIITSGVAHELLAEDSRNADVVKPYLNGDDLNSNYDQIPSRWAISFANWTLERALTYIGPMSVVQEYVYPERMGSKKGREEYNKMWWQFWRPRIELYRKVASLNRVLVTALTSKYLLFTFVDANWIYAHACGVVASEQASIFTILQSNFHDAWARKYGSTLETRLRYTPADVFETYPFPEQKTILITKLEAIGETYSEHRRQIMLVRREGLTKAYNRFHNPDERSADIAHLRELHVQMDQAVATAYGWDDLDLGHGFHETPQGMRYTLSEPARREVLSRLLQLNHERYEEEVQAGLHEKKGGKNKGARRQNQGNVSNEESPQYKFL